MSGLPSGPGWASFEIWNSFFEECRSPICSGLQLFHVHKDRLLLQCLEAEYYSWAAYGEGIYTVDQALVGKLSLTGACACLDSLAQLVELSF